MTDAGTYFNTSLLHTALAFLSPGADFSSASPKLLFLLPPLLALSALFVFALLRRRRKSSPRDLPAIGCAASVAEPLDPEGAVLVRGELWRARSATGATLPRGRLNVRIVGARGHLLEAEPRERSCA